MVSNSPDLNLPDYHGGYGGVLLASIEAKRIPEFKDGLRLIWSAVPEKKPLYKAVRLSQETAGMCVSQR